MGLLLFELLNDFEYFYGIILWIVILYSFQDAFIFDFELSFLDEFISIALLSKPFFVQFVKLCDAYTNWLKELLLNTIDELEFFAYLMVYKSRSIDGQFL